MSIAAAERPPRVRLLATPALVATFAMFVLAATAFCVIAGFVLVNRADDRLDLERRAALLGAVEDLRAAGSGFQALDPQRLRGVERIAGLKDLRFANEPDARDRELQSVFDRQGRIIGWFSWQPERSMSKALTKLRPLLAITGLCLVGFAVLALWMIRRALRDLASSERRAWRLAHEDMLTGLPNHRKMIELTDAALAARAPGETVTLAFIDLDGLSDINDTLGHPAGDRLLAAFATRFRELLPDRSVGGRFDGDEFAVVMTTADDESARVALRTLAMALKRPYWISEQAVQVGVTVGFAHAPLNADSRDDLARRADLALRAAKRKERGGVFRFVPVMDAEFDDRRFIERELRRALDDGELDVHYQPIVTSDGARIVGAEALLRWDHPVRGAISPTTFVAAAEQTGLMAKLGEFVLRRACSDVKRWPGLQVAVNLSPVQVRDPALCELVADALRQSDIAPSRLVLEITEGVLIDDPQAAKAPLAALRARGVKLALDDFGTGYSSLTYLQRFPFDKLKIDKGFVAPLGRDATSQALVAAIVGLGRALDLTILAEGVETEEQRVLLRLAGCAEMRGFLFAHPGPREALDRLVEAATAATVRPALRAFG
jgi:diguanylate cyclase (GGDEF)-like protein